MRRILLLACAILTFQWAVAQIITSQVTIESTGDLTKIQGKTAVAMTSDPVFDLTVSANLNNPYLSTPDIAAIGIMTHGIGTGQGNLYLHRDDVTISTGDILGALKFSGADGGEQIGAEIRGVSSGSWNPGSSAGDLVFLTNPTGVTEPVERMRINRYGNVAIGRSTAFATLDVLGTIRASSYFRSVTGKYTGDAAGDDYYQINDANHRWHIDNERRLSLESGRLHVIGKTAAYSDFVGHTGETAGYLPNGKEPTLVIEENISGNYQSGVGGQRTYRGGMSFGRGGPGIYSINDNPAGSSYYGDIRFHTTSWDGSAYRNYDRMVILRNGNVGIGTNSPGYKLHVNGSLNASSLYNSGQLEWSDFVFKNDYDLPSLEEVEEHIAKNGHLMDIPSEEEVLDKGYDLGTMDSKLLQKIEELTLYLIEQNKKIERMEKEIAQLKEK